MKLRSEGSATVRLDGYSLNHANLGINLAPRFEISYRREDHESKFWEKKENISFMSLGDLEALHIE